MALVTLAALAVMAAAVTVSAENTPPAVTVDTPRANDALAQSVTLSGRATDSEGFNVDSYVEARWNDWEWFRLPITAADGNRSMVFGEMVNLGFHAPGEHTLHVRAFDGELYSEVASVPVTVRDLGDLVVMPTDITMRVVGVTLETIVEFHVVVHNQGGEDIHQVEVGLFIDGVEVDDASIDVVDAYSEERVVFERGLAKGRSYDVRVTASPHLSSEERSRENNEASRWFEVTGDEGTPVRADGGISDQGMVILTLLTAGLVGASVWMALSVVRSRKA